MERLKKDSISMLQFWFVANTVLWPLSVKVSDFALGLNVVLLLLVGFFWFWKKHTVTFSSAKIIGIILIYLIFSFYLVATGPCTDKKLKSFITAPILISLILLGWEVGQAANSRDWINLHKAAVISLLAALGGFVFELLFPSLYPFQIIYRVDWKLSGLFQEPSHVAFSLFPCVAVLLVDESRKIRRWGMIALLGVLLLSHSSTLFAFMAVWFFYRLFVQRRLREGALLGFSVLALLALAMLVNYEALVQPTAERIMGVVGSSNTENFSSLVYIQGWQDAWVNLLRTHGLGLGFNMMGCTPLPDVSVRDLLALGGAGEINAEDGSFQFAKIVSETGAIGILFYVGVIWWWLRLESRARKAIDKTTRSALAVQAALTFFFIASSFIRGTSYFGAGILLWIVAASGASRWQRKSLAQASS